MKTCDSLMKKYKAMKEMYSDADLKGMLNPDAYSDLEREMKDAGIVIEKKMHDVSISFKTLSACGLGQTIRCAHPKYSCTEKINFSKLVNRLSNQTSFGLSN